VIVYAVIDLRSSSGHPLGDAIETFVRRETPSALSRKFTPTVPSAAGYLRIDERELETVGRSYGRPVALRPYPAKRRSTIDALCPPKPDEFETATPTLALRASFGT
jgi:hypothetical protein